MILLNELTASFRSRKNVKADNTILYVRLFKLWIEMHMVRWEHAILTQ